MPESSVVSVITAASGAPEKQGTTAQIWADYDLPEGVTRMSGTLYVPQRYYGLAGERKVGRLVVLNELNGQVYSSPDLTTRFDPVPFDIPLTGVKRVRIVVMLYPYDGVALDDDFVMAQMGISQLKFE